LLPGETTGQPGRWKKDLVDTMSRIEKCGAFTCIYQEMDNLSNLPILIKIAIGRKTSDIKIAQPSRISVAVADSSFKIVNFF
jgi:hypothetical protein